VRNCRHSSASAGTSQMSRQLRNSQGCLSRRFSAPLESAALWVFISDACDVILHGTYIVSAVSAPSVSGRLSPAYPLNVCMPCWFAGYVTGSWFLRVDRMPTTLWISSTIFVLLIIRSFIYNPPTASLPCSVYWSAHSLEDPSLI